MSNVNLLDATFTDGLRLPHYVNQRLLTAEDLRTDQGATVNRLGYLGKAAGHGIVEGLLVTQSGNATVQIAPGLGINREGTVLRLPGAVTLALAPTAGAPGKLADDAGRFQNCTVGTPVGPVASLTEGAYLLTMLPATQLEGAAPLKAAAGATLPAGCASRWETDGVQFKTVKLAGFGTGGSGATAKNRQSVLAHWCFGSGRLPELAANPFIFDDEYGGLDLLTAAEFSNCDLPLAVFYWQSGKLAFVDAWAVRRRLTQPGPWQSWRGLIADRRVADAHARFLQFQAQIDVLLAANLAGSAVAKEYFRHLPPVGFLPVRSPSWLIQAVVVLLADLLRDDVSGKRVVTADRASVRDVAGRATFNTANVFARNTAFAQAEASLAGAAPAAAAATSTATSALIDAIIARLPKSGFDLAHFFGNALPGEVVFIDGESVDYVLQQSWHDEAIDLSVPSPFDIYLVRDVWLRLVGEALIAVLGQQSRTVGLRSSAQDTVIKQIRAVLPPAVPGAADTPYALFVKQPRPPQRVKITLTPEKPSTGITGSVVIWHGLDAAGADANALGTLVAQVQSEHPAAKITVVALPGGQLRSALPAAVAAGEGPDLVLTTNDVVGVWAGQKLIQPIDALHARDGDVADIAYASLSAGNSLYGVPLSLAGVALYYNRDRISTPPATTTALRDLMREQVRPAIPRTPYFTYGFYAGFGGKLLDAAGRCTATQGGFGETMRYFQVIQKLGALFSAPDTCEQIFGQNEAHMLVGGPWSLAALRKTVGSALAVAPLPAGPIGASRPLLTVDGFLLVQTSNNAENAVRVAEALTSAAAQTLFATEADRVPANLAVKQIDPLLSAFSTALVAAEPWPQQPQFAAWWVPFQTMLDSVLEAGADVDSAVAEACKAMDTSNGF